MILRTKEEEDEEDKCMLAFTAAFYYELICEKLRKYENSVSQKLGSRITNQILKRISIILSTFFSSSM